MSILPPAPRRLRPGFVLLRTIAKVGLATLGLLMLGWMGSYAVGELGALRDDQEVWTKGKALESAVVHPKTRAHRGFRDYELDVRWVDESGAAHQTTSEFSCLFGGPDTNTPPTVQILEGEPPRVVVSWAIDAADARWRSIVVLAIGAAAFGGGLLALALMVHRKSAATRRAADEGREVEARLLDTRRIYHQGRVAGRAYCYVLADDETEREWEWRVGRDDPGPLFLDDERHSFLVLASDNAHLVVRADLHPLEIDDVTKRRIAAALIARGAPPPT